MSAGKGVKSVGKKETSRKSEASMTRLIIKNLAPIIEAIATVITSTALLIQAIAALSR
ncbi:hypothetical protein H8R18_00790 [Nanchangia anserum]|uniref:Uncharacterized protein n=1 Tax=Nanchangia anserum TaxID=2692125 RepID=A0A8I0GDZ1_9ACTO|nr:hypothetical protein [Nanchangia anserum]MBD3689778.1 hypothetical protein [Nanchangia anserum]QOX81952.1 hypothetical protein H8R18_00790 [Nanchangia anserum]